MEIAADVVLDKVLVEDAIVKQDGKMKKVREQTEMNGSFFEFLAKMIGIRLKRGGL